MSKAQRVQRAIASLLIMAGAMIPAESVARAAASPAPGIRPLPATPQFQPSQPNISALELPIRSVANGGTTSDHMCYLQQRFTTQAPALIAAEKATHATYATYDGPYDPATSDYASCRPGPLTPLGFEQLWVTDIHAAGLHAWFRQSWNTWGPWYGKRKLTYATHPAVPYESPGGASAVLNGTDKTSYLAKTFYFILQHPGLYSNGDIFTPQSEPEGGGIGCASCQFPSVAEFNRFMRDSMTVDRTAFYKIGVNVFVGMWGVSCTALTLDQSTVRQMGIVSTDCYLPSASDMRAALARLYAAYGVHLTVGEWGDIWDYAVQPRMNTKLDTILGVLTTTAYVVGVNYWQAIGGPGGEGLVAPETLTLNPAGREFAKWYATWKNQWFVWRDVILEPMRRAR